MPPNLLPPDPTSTNSRAPAGRKSRAADYKYTLGLTIQLPEALSYEEALTLDRSSVRLCPTASTIRMGRWSVVRFNSDFGSTANKEYWAKFVAFMDRVRATPVPRDGTRNVSCTADYTIDQMNDLCELIELSVLRPGGFFQSLGVYRLHTDLEDCAVSRIVNNEMWRFNYNRIREHPRCLDSSFKRMDESFELFYRLNRSARLPIPRYKIKDQDLSARLYAYQEAAVRFMIHRELNPEVDLAAFRYVQITPRSGAPYNYYFNMGMIMESVIEAPQLFIRGGILADEMGLGKTVELIALITTMARGSAPPSEVGYEEVEIEDDVTAVVNGLVNDVVTVVDGAQNVRDHPKINSKKKRTSFHYEARHEADNSVHCTECGVGCDRDAVHWTTDVASKHFFLCPECMDQQDIAVGTTLIVVPRTLQQQWFEELRRHVKTSVKINMYAGVKVEGYKHPYFLGLYDIVIVAYETLASELVFSKLNASRCSRNKRQKISPTPMTQISWWRMVMDEGQVVSNANKASEICNLIRATNRWVVTGTPFRKSINDDILGHIGTLKGFNNVVTKRFFAEVFLDPYSRLLFPPLIDLTSQIFWRTSKKDIDHYTPTKTVLHEVPLNAAERCAYSQMMKDATIEVMSILKYYGENTPLSELSRKDREALNASFSRARQFLLTTDKKNSMVPYSVDEFYECKYDDLRMDAVKAILDASRIMCMNADCVPLGEQAVPYLKKALKIYEGVVEINTKRLGVPDVNHFCAKEDGESLNVYERDENGRIPFRKHVIFNSHRYVEIFRKLTFHFFHNKLFRKLQWIAKGKNVPLKDLVDERFANIATLKQAWQSCVVDFDVVVNDAFNGYAESFGSKRGDMNEVSAVNYVNALIREVKTSLSEDSCARLVEQIVNSGISLSGVPNIEKIGKWLRGSICNASTAVCRIVNLVSKLKQIAFRMHDAEESIAMEDWQKFIVEFQNQKTLPVLVEPCYDVWLLDDATIYNKLLLCRNSKNSKKTCNDTNACIGCALMYTLRELMAPAQNSKTVQESWKQKATFICETIWEHLTKELGWVRMTAIKDKLEKERANFANHWKLISAAHYSSEIILNAVKDKMAQVRGVRYQTVSESSNLKPEHDRSEKSMKHRSESYERCVEKIKNTVSMMVFMQKSEKKSNCVVCMEEFSAGFGYPCGHYWCCSCDQQWRTAQAATGKRAECPECRENIPKADRMFVRQNTRSNEKEDWLTFIKSLFPSKLNGILDILLKIQKESPRDKILIFTSTEACQNAVATLCRQAQLKFAALKGNKSTEALSLFRTSPNVNILVMRYASGGMGLNLAEANQVLFVEAIDDPVQLHQAIGRVDRIGQKKHIFIHHVVAKDTVEESIYNISRDCKTFGSSTGAGSTGEASWTVSTMLRLLLGEEDGLFKHQVNLASIEVWKARNAAETGAAAEDPEGKAAMIEAAVQQSLEALFASHQWNTDNLELVRTYLS